ncbi:hypothetical protein ABIA39_004245 [Nocardia sp. GAS34]|uniref:hypothetical protein n=1 Tax=unclassified Nocardia TaxID=2637762 RepID=UPI003D1A7622
MATADSPRTASGGSLQAANYRDVEAVRLPGDGAFWLLEDSERTGGLFGANRLLLPAGADGTRPHHHTLSTEFFYILAHTTGCPLRPKRPQKSQPTTTNRESLQKSTSAIATGVRGTARYCP